MADLGDVRAHQHIPARIHRLHPFCLLPQSDAGHCEEVGLFLNAARIGEDKAGVLLQHEHIEIAHRIQEMDTLLGQMAWGDVELNQFLAGAGVDGKDDGLIHAHESFDQGLQPLRIIGVAGAMHRSQQVATSGETQLLQNDGSFSGLLAEQEHGIVHDIAGEENAFPDAFIGQIIHCGSRRAEE